MANTYTQIYLHIVFAVEGRQNLIQPEHNDELQKYITGIVSGQKQKLIAINNMPDHLHLLVGLKPDMALSDLMRDVKANSSKFINEKRWVAGRFSWQEGFGAFSYSRSQLGAVICYSENQQKHHAKNRSARNTLSCWKSSTWSTTRDTFSKWATNDFPKMPPRRGLKANGFWLLQSCRAYGARGVALPRFGGQVVGEAFRPQEPRASPEANAAPPSTGLPPLRIRARDSPGNSRRAGFLPRA